MLSLRLLFLLSWLALGCGTLCHAQTEGGQPPREPVITLARGPDYWGLVAPVYRLEIYADGGVVFTGEKNVKTIGVAKGRISEKQLRWLITEFEKINYFSLRDSYGESGGCPSYLTDGPTARTEVRLSGKRKSVIRDSGCYADEKLRAPFPEGLSQLEELIDEVVNSSQWVK